MTTPIGSSTLSDNCCRQPHPTLVEVNAFLESSLRIIVPVTQCDRPTIVEALIHATKVNLNYKQALESLHGVNEHVASQWKDYYLEHKDEIDKAVLHHLEPPPLRTPLTPDRLVPRPMPCSRSGAKKPFTYLPPASTTEVGSDSESDGTPCPPPRKAVTPKTWTRRSKFASPGSTSPWIDRHLKTPYAEFTSSDMDKMVGYIVYQKKWKELHKERRWAALSREAQPYRSPNAWQHHYIKRKETVDRKVQELKHKVQIDKRSRGEYKLENQNFSQAMFLPEGSAYETGSTTSEATDDSSVSTMSS